MFKFSLLTNFLITPKLIAGHLFVSEQLKS
jgi:hypothetical protein